MQFLIYACMIKDLTVTTHNVLFVPHYHVQYHENIDADKFTRRLKIFGSCTILLTEECVRWSLLLCCSCTSVVVVVVSFRIRWTAYLHIWLLRCTFPASFRESKRDPNRWINITQHYRPTRQMESKRERFSLNL